MTSNVDRMESRAFSGAGGNVSAMWNFTGQSWGYKGGEPATVVGPGITEARVQLYW